MYAAYLYLTQPDHPAVRVVAGQRHEAAALRHVPIDPKDIVVAGDSAGAAVISAFKLYVRDYVQPSLPTKMEMPSTTVLLSGWVDITTSMPAASECPTYCYTPSVMGLNPFNRVEFDGVSKRNAMGQDLCWEWYRHLAQHPLVNIAYNANLDGFGDTLLQAGTFDRLRDDTRLLAHRLGHHNKDSQETRIRIEIYRDMVHVHQFFEFLPLAKHALKNIVAFVEHSQKQCRARHAKQSCGEEQLDDTKDPSSGENAPQQPQQPQQPRYHARKGSSSFVIKASATSNGISGTEDMFHQRNTSIQPLSTRGQVCKTGTTVSSGTTEWIFVELDGRENFSMEGVPIDALEACWSRKQPR
ncbi:hypothetical protein BGZ73_005748 [Actinomortierella ambigua]|nr:hypothetical protein BGZ73_005748 [Actinomortierella ambigua]